VDPALRRSGRFGKTIYIPAPDQTSRTEILKMHSKKRPIVPLIPYPLLALATIAYASSDLKAIVDEAASFPWLEAFFSIQKKTEEQMKKGMTKEQAEEIAKKQVTQRPLNLADFTLAVIRKRSSLPPWYEQAKKQIGKQEEITIVDGKEHKKVSDSKMGPGEKEAFKDLLSVINSMNEWYMKIWVGVVKQATLVVLRILSLILAQRLVIS
jgi:SpoVK/Ycf46/Vps4 family AAA+-type ATPase